MTGGRQRVAGDRLVVDRLPAAAGGCYLTFDDGPDPHWTPRVLRVLEQFDVRATFFVIGRLAREFGPLLREIRAAGHTIGNHAWSHRNPWTATHAQARHEVGAGADAITAALGERPAWFRPPYGRLSATLAAAARAEGERIALWSLSAQDWGPFGAPQRIESRLRGAAAGDIVLMHDGPWLDNRPSSTLRVLPAVLERLLRDGPLPLPLPDGTIGG